MFYNSCIRYLKVRCAMQTSRHQLKWPSKSNLTSNKSYNSINSLPKLFVNMTITYLPLIILQLQAIMRVRCVFRVAQKLNHSVSG